MYFSVSNIENPWNKAEHDYLKVGNVTDTDFIYENDCRAY